MARKIITIIIVILALWVISLSISKIGNIRAGDQIAIIPIKGTITTTESFGVPFSPIKDSSSIIKKIEKAKLDTNVKGIILEINSPGGTVVASKEVVDAVKSSNKPVVAWIREIGTSGAYWIASASDKIVADSLSITGSIGVTASYLEFSELLGKYGIEYESLKTGEFKDIASPFRNLTAKEKDILLKKLQKIHEVFVDDVAKNRNLDKKTVSELANGIYYLGEEAKELGLVDYLGNKELDRKSVV